MFCRFCGAHLLDDSLFCAKCGKRLGRAVHPRLEKVSRILRLRTPYPYAALIFLFAAWRLAVSSITPPFDYSGLEWTLQMDRKLDLPEENLFQQGFSLVLENAGARAIREVPVELSAHIEPMQPADIAATFLGRRLSIMVGGKSLPLTVILADEVRPGGKRSFLIDGSIQAHAPFKVTYEIRDEREDTVLASFVVER